MNGIHMRRFRNVPPLQYLLGFEAASRLASFTSAAAELGLTQSAISHQMRLLEERIGQPLFIRVGRSVVLTDAGRDYQRSVVKSLEQLEGGYRRLEPYRKPGSVVIYAPRDFAARWLMPRLHLLRQAVPACDPWIDTSGTAVDFDGMEASIAIVRSVAPNENLQSMLLMRDFLAPVAAPTLGCEPITKAGDLLKFTLLHDERADGWQDWFAHMGWNVPDIAAGLDFSDSDFALHAAELGLGVALASLPLAAQALTEGALVPLSLETMPTQHAWFATSTAKELSDSVTRDVWDWLARAAGLR
jgi:LysR family transcriptional regulator, glycine cleavage system transcriptional activator